MQLMYVKKKKVVHLVTAGAARGPQQLDLGSQAEVILCLGPHISVDAIVSALLSRRRRTVLETVQHSSALLTRVHIATGALWLPDLAPVDSDDQHGLFQVLQLSPWTEERRPQAASSFALSCFQRHFSVAAEKPFSVQISSATASYCT